MNIVKKLARIGTGAALILVDKVALPWYESHRGATMHYAKNNSYELRNEVARKVHEGLARSVWRLRDEDIHGAIEFLVRTVEPETLEDGEYVLMVSLEPRAVSFEEDAEYQPIRPIPLYAFLEKFTPIGTIELSDYNA